MRDARRIGAGALALALCGAAVISAGAPEAPSPRLGLLDGTVYPENMGPPAWTVEAVDGPWQIEIAVAGGELLGRLVGEGDHYQVAAGDWQAWRDAVRGGQAEVTLIAGAGDRAATARFAFDDRPLTDELVFRHVEVPFGADRTFATSMRVQGVDEARSRPLQPAIPDTPCAGCHASAPDGGGLALQIRDPYDPRIALSAPAGPWRAIPSPGGALASGLAFAPDGQLVVAVNVDVEQQLGDDRFSRIQRGSDLARLDPATGIFEPIEGAADPRVCEDFPDVSPDGRTVAFVRGEVLHSHRGSMGIWTVPLAGGAASPLPGASGGDGARYFPRHAPDGRQLVFVRSDGGYFARPSADLHIVPAGGGEARPLACNADGAMDSWPAWSSDGRWLAFASGRHADGRTRIHISRVDDEGRASPPFPIPGDPPAGHAANHPSLVPRGDGIP